VDPQKLVFVETSAARQKRPLSRKSSREQSERESKSRSSSSSNLPPVKDDLGELKTEPASSGRMSSPFCALCVGVVAVGATYVLGFDGPLKWLLS
jgi:hypothetical protein